MTARAPVVLAAWLATLGVAMTAHTQESRAEGTRAAVAPSPARVRLTDAPCAGCVASFAPGDDRAPLLVVLHGDSGHGPAELSARWEKLVAPQRAAVLALACPKDRGCKGSYWRWNGAPSWIAQQVDALAGRRALDRKRMWLVGWSGGASYMGYRTQELEQTFAALVFHGGGIPPALASCGAAKRPTYFLVGEANPLHHLARSLRAHYVGCGQEARWSLLPRANHAAEWRGLDAHGEAIAAWLATKRLE